MFSYGDKCDGLADDVTVNGTATISDTTHALKVQGHRGLFGINSATRIKDIPDGLSSTVGIHRVQIETMEGVVVAPVKGLSTEDQPRVEKSVLPAKYPQHKSSGLTAEVTSKGPDHFLFSLDDSPPPKAAR